MESSQPLNNHTPAIQPATPPPTQAATPQKVKPDTGWPFVAKVVATFVVGIFAIPVGIILFIPWQLGLGDYARRVGLLPAVFDDDCRADAHRFNNEFVGGTSFTENCVLNDGDLQLTRFTKLKIDRSGEYQSDKLDGVFIEPADKRDTSRPTVIYFCPNLASYEQFARKLAPVYLAAGYNLLMFNYAGVGLSEGTTQGVQDLLNDGRAVIEFARDKDNLGLKGPLLLHGNSLGAAVATVLHVENPETSLMNTTSFTNFRDAVSGFVNRYTFLGPLVGALYADKRWQLDAIENWEKRKGGHVLAVTAQRDGIVSDPSVQFARNVNGVVHVTYDMKHYEPLYFPIQTTPQWETAYDPFLRAVKGDKGVSLPLVYSWDYWLDRVGDKPLRAKDLKEVLSLLESFNNPQQQLDANSIARLMQIKDRVGKLIQKKPNAGDQATFALHILAVAITGRIDQILFKSLGVRADTGVLASISVLLSPQVKEHQVRAIESQFPETQTRFEWYERMAARGFEGARDRVAQMLVRGDDVAIQNIPVAIQALEESIDPRAQPVLAGLYRQTGDFRKLMQLPKELRASPEEMVKQQDQAKKLFDKGLFAIQGMIRKGDARPPVVINEGDQQRIEELYVLYRNEIDSGNPLQVNAFFNNLEKYPASLILGLMRKVYRMLPAPIPPEKIRQLLATDIEIIHLKESLKDLPELAHICRELHDLVLQHPTQQYSDVAFKRHVQAWAETLFGPVLDEEQALHQQQLLDFMIRNANVVFRRKQ